MIKGAFVTVKGEVFYKIENYDQMRPFFISLVSHTDLWLFVSTSGGLTAGRINENSSIFPYYTDDKLEDNAENTGSKTIIRVVGQGKNTIWEPFSVRSEYSYTASRNLYKSKAGNQLIFEETNQDLNLTFRYTWRFSEKYGLVKTSELINNSDDSIKIEILDGIQNILPYGVGANLQSASSNLVNAYKKNELDSESGLGIFVLSSMIVDKAEPAEALKATTVWTTSQENQKVLLSSVQLKNFRKGEAVTQEEDVRAERGCYFIVFEKDLNPNTSSHWDIVAEVNQDHSQVVSLINAFHNKQALKQKIEEDVLKGTDNLLALVGKADGLQYTQDELSTTRHYANVLFNVMRGGIFEDGYQVEVADFKDYLRSINCTIFQKYSSELGLLGEIKDYQSLINWSIETGDSSLIRISYEYLPLSFSRRHGDPSRPWNKFSINTRKADGSKNRDYQGNWRDIFQNWEALSLSFPSYILSMITKFVNASTLDGYNPYRITREGIDWEVIEPDNPWSYIGYWGDHQIIYLLKLMEIAQTHFPDQLADLFSKEHFVYADVPYRIKGYSDIVKDPQDTIEFDEEVNKNSEERSETIGGDGKLVYRDGQIFTANLNEKILVSLLVKLSNLVPEGGIWMNTQRPEWNDANNALVGNGLSMVTLYYMRRFVTFYSNSLDSVNELEFKVNSDLYDLLNGISDTFSKYSDSLSNSISDIDRKHIVDSLGKVGEQYRTQVYSGVSLETKHLKKSEIKDFLNITLKFLDHSIHGNKREDGLYHSYNLLKFEGDKLKVEHMYEMLEGQVSILSSGVLTMREAMDLLDALKSSKIYREDQYSYMLYPNRQLSRFLDKNTISKEFIDRSKLAQALISQGDRSVLIQDENGATHFNGSFTNAKDLVIALDKLDRSKFTSMVDEEQKEFLEIFEQIFNHRAFTGRSGTFYGFEGLGSIYWHMVSKLLLATQENIVNNWQEESDDVVKGRMIDHYYEIRAGIGVNKSPELFGAVPTDPYSHTPGNKGAQQPGMTGQVKEDVINRWAELGVSVKDGCLSFDPIFLNEQEFLKEANVFEYYDIKGVKSSLQLEESSLAFTYCQLPVVYKKSDKRYIIMQHSDGRNELITNTFLTKEISKEIFQRTGSIAALEVGI